MVATLISDESVSNFARGDHALIMVPEPAISEDDQVMRDAGSIEMMMEPGPDLRFGYSPDFNDLSW